MYEVYGCEGLSHADLARGFVILKENFAEMGLYDDEDDAFVLYMKFKPGIDTESRMRKHYKKPINILFCVLNYFKKVTYKFLNLVGGYGTAPLRVLVSLIVVVFASAGIYWGCAKDASEMVFSLGNALANSAPNEANFWVALFYSLGNVIPFTSEFEPIAEWVCAVTVVENVVGTFLVGYFSVAVVRKTLR